MWSCKTQHNAGTKYGNFKEKKVLAGSIPMGIHRRLWLQWQQITQLCSNVILWVITLNKRNVVKGQLICDYPSWDKNWLFTIFVFTSTKALGLSFRCSLIRIFLFVPRKKEKCSAATFCPVNTWREMFKRNPLARNYVIWIEKTTELMSKVYVSRLSCSCLLGLVQMVNLPKENDDSILQNDRSVYYPAFLVDGLILCIKH